MLTVSARLTIRPAVAQDAEALAPLALLAMSGVTDYLLADVVPGLSTVEIVAAQLADAQHPLSFRSCKVAELDGGVVGIMQAHTFDEAIPPLDLPIPAHRFAVYAPAEAMEAPGSYYIDALAVGEPFRGRGIGRKLLLEAVADAAQRGHRTLSLHVFAENLSAVRLYAANGFRIVDRRPAVWHEPMRFKGDLLLMVAKAADTPG